MVRTLRTILSSPSKENSAIDSLDTTKTYRYVKLSKQLLTGFPVVVNVVVGYNLLIELEEMNLV